MSVETQARFSSSPANDALVASQTRYVVTVDTEEEWDWNSGWPAGAASVKNIQRLPEFQQICERRRASVTYFTNHAVLNDDRASEVIENLSARPGVEIGMHIHPWNTPPIASDELRSARGSFLANHLPDRIRAKLSTVLERFSDRGIKPTSFRGGRYSSGPVVQEFLADCGFVADASVVPYTTWPDDGAPDYRQRDLEPRRTVINQRPLWEIPLTMGFSRQPFATWRNILERVEASPLRHLRLIGIADRLNLVRRAWLSFEDPLGQHMLPFLRQLRRLRLSHVCFTLHSSSLLAGANGCYSRTPADVQRLLAQVDEILGVLSQWPEFKPATISEIAQHLEQQYAGSRN